MFEQLQDQIAIRIADLPNGTRFNLRDLLGAAWPEGAGDARQLGRDFRQNLPNFPGVEDAGKDDENLRWYLKQ
ncbi:DUF1413 domain-containing protein [Paracoccus siganidrum]|uniref:DUF1413 domain-containing protein n=1 Tax=Paracoccus siganidrum TaxID=1276757 RepID=A0A419ACG1_9RHOB|nr:DUF1413 domain-containing protein [Paracoccus siganidrum]RJL22156.1 DUF1413 domain-containing protein [Paracoccus siganidrum]RMC30415.1 hypothetical protein C9E82_17870 [Paracoccus siganidrum]